MSNGVFSVKTDQWFQHIRFSKNNADNPHTQNILTIENVNENTLFEEEEQRRKYIIKRQITFLLLKRNGLVNSIFELLFSYSMEIYEK